MERIIISVLFAATTYCSFMAFLSYRKFKKRLEKLAQETYWTGDVDIKNFLLEEMAKVLKITLKKPKDRK